VKVTHHQGWAAVQFTPGDTREVDWEIEFQPADSYYHYPQAVPEGVAAERAGLDGVNLTWQEQYWLNDGYQVYLNGELQGHTPVANFPLRGLDPRSNYVASVKCIWQDGRESPRGGEVRFSLASMVPPLVSLTQVEPMASTGRWRGLQADISAAAPVSLGGNNYEHALSSGPNGEIEFDLNGLFSRFTSVVGFERGAGGGGTNVAAAFIVLGDDKELWNSGQLTRSDDPKPVDVSVQGVDKLKLRVSGTAGGRRGGGGGRRGGPSAAWADPKLMRQQSQ
jgi:hypothetical protein